MEEDSKSGEGETRTPMVKKDSIQMAAAVSRDLREAYSFIFEIKYFALATLLDVWTAFIMRFLTWADSDADTAVGCDGEDGEEEDEEELNGLRPPKDIF